MSNAYAYGYDYDSYRSDVTGYSREMVLDKTKSRPMKRYFWIIVTLIIVVLLGWYALRFIPLFDITEVVISSNNAISSVPSAAKQLGEAVLGQSMASSAPRNLKHALTSLSMVEDVSLVRRSFSRLEAELTIYQPNVGIAVVEDDTTLALYLVKDRKLERISHEDFALYGHTVFTVEVNPTYGDYLVTYGLDPGMEEVIELANQMGMDTGERYRIVGRIRYQEGLENTFGNMIIDLPAYNSNLYIRESISESRLHDALRLIKLEHKDNQLRNIALIGQLRYDLYARSLVSRQ